jgi:heme-degrading monooxygenase HmoA
MHVKSGQQAEFNRIIEKDVIPLLKRQKGFRDEIVLANPGSTEVAGISFWENKEDAENYNRETYAEVQRFLVKVLDGTPQVKTYEVSYSSLPKITARAATA